MYDIYQFNRVGRKGQGRDGIAKAALILHCHFYFHTQLKQEVAHCFCKRISLSLPALGHNWYETPQVNLWVTSRWPQKSQQHLSHTEPTILSSQNLSWLRQGTLAEGAWPKKKLCHHSAPPPGPHPRLVHAHTQHWDLDSILCKGTWAQIPQPDGRLKDTTSLEEKSCA